MDPPPAMKCGLQCRRKWCMSTTNKPESRTRAVDRPQENADRTCSMDLISEKIYMNEFCP